MAFRANRLDPNQLKNGGVGGDFERYEFVFTPSMRLLLDSLSLFDILEASIALNKVYPQLTSVE